MYRPIYSWIRPVELQSKKLINNITESNQIYTEKYGNSNNIKY